MAQGDLDPALRVAATEDINNTFNPQGPTVQQKLSQIAQGFQKALGARNAPQQAAGAEEAQPESEAQARHMSNLRDAAEAAKQKYMLENGVDENGNPVSQ